MFRRGVRILFFILGWFELFMVFKIFTQTVSTSSEQQPYYPQQFFQYPTRYLLIMWTLFLGLIRLVWSVSDNTFPAWLFIVVAHMAETTFLWGLATLPHFNPMRYPVQELMVKVLNLEVGNSQGRFVMFFVPILVLLLLFHGPGDSRKTTKPKKE